MTYVTVMTHPVLMACRGRRTAVERIAAPLGVGEGGMFAHFTGKEPKNQGRVWVT